jgi:hypothetical protein
MTDSEQRLPPHCIGSDTKLKSSAIINATEDYYIVLHYWSETRALQCSTPDSLEELIVEINWIGPAVNSLLQKLDELNGCPMKHMSFMHGDMLTNVPRVLTKVSQIH